MRYYFSKLDKEGREIYKKLYFGMQNFEKNPPCGHTQWPGQ